MTINIKNFLNDKTKLSKMGEFQSLKQIEGLEMASISADLYRDGRDDLALFYFSKGANYATLTTSNSITSEFIPGTTIHIRKLLKVCWLIQKTQIHLQENKEKKVLIF